MALRNQVQLITYPDSLGGDLPALRRLLQGEFAGLFGGVHILPPFPSSGDRGFAPLTYFEVDSRFGGWEDIRAIGDDCDVVLDLMVNHISARSPYFEDFLRRGSKSPSAGMFLTPDKIWPDGQPRQQDIDRMFLRRPVPYSRFRVGEDGTETLVWTTFGKTDPSEQIDLDVRSPQTMRLFEDIFRAFAEHGVRVVRLDAVGYVAKKAGTSCFFVEPEVGEFLNRMRELAGTVGMDVLPEVHAEHHLQFSLAQSGYWTYDFVLPFLVLEALLAHDGARLAQYLRVRPSNQFTMLDCHDGIPVKPDLDGLVSAEDAKTVVDVCLVHGANLSRILSEKDKGEDGFDVHQIRCSYYSALGCDDRAYLTARAIQFFAPGIPQVYYAGLLAAENDMDAVKQTGEGREINRHNFRVREIETALQRPVVRSLLWLIRLRNSHPAFQGVFRLIDHSACDMRLTWETNTERCQLILDFVNASASIQYTDGKGRMRECQVDTTLADEAFE